MKEEYERLALLIGEKAWEKLRSCKVLLFGVGGVGGYAAEALARSGVGTIDLVDHDTVSVTNRNRQIIALNDTVGRLKTDVMKERIAKIDPEITVNTYPFFYLPEEKEKFDFASYDYIIDCIDTVTAKIDIILEAERAGVPVISAMGCGNRIDPSRLVCTDIYKTEGDPLAKVMRRELKKRNVKKLKVVYSTETPLKPLHKEDVTGDNLKGSHPAPGSTAFVPPAGGLLIASAVVRDLIDYDPAHRE